MIEEMSEVKTDSKFQLSPGLQNVGMSYAEIGGGFNFITGKKTETTALKTPSLKTKPGGGININSQLIKSKSSTKEVLDLALGGTYVSKDTKASGSVKFLSHIEFSSTSVTLVCSVNCIGQLKTIDNPELTKEALDLMADPEKFRSHYGDYFISGAIESKKMYISYTFRSESQKNITDLKLKLDGKKAKDLIDLQVDIDTMSKSQEVEVDINLDIVGKPKSPVDPPKTFKEAADLMMKFQEPDFVDMELTDFNLTAYFTLSNDYPDFLNGDMDNLINMLTYNKLTYVNDILLSDIPSDKYPESYADYEHNVERLYHTKDLALDITTLNEIKASFDTFEIELDPIIKRKEIYDKIIDDKNTEYHGRVNHGVSGTVWTKGIAKGVDYGLAEGTVKMEHREAHLNGSIWESSKTVSIVIEENLDRLYCGWTVMQADGTTGQWYIEGIIGLNSAKSHYSNDKDNMTYEVYHYYLDSKEYDFSKK